MGNDLGNRIDLICQHSMDGTVIPIRMRFWNEDGEQQEFTIKSYRSMSGHGQEYADKVKKH